MHEFIPVRTPNKNAHIESFFSILKLEFLEVNYFSTNRRADQTFIDEFKRKIRNESFDEQPMVELKSEAINFQAAFESFKSIEQLKTNDLKTLKLVTRFQGCLVPTTGEIILFSVEREKYFKIQT